MQNLLQFEPGQILGFLVIFTRISGVMVVAPVLGDNNIPPQIKIIFTFLLTLIFYPVVAAPSLGANPNIADLANLTLLEFGVGMLMGFSARLLFSSVSLAGEVVGFQMGIGIANIFDPTSQAQISLIGQLNTIFALLLFVVLDGHHIFIKALAESYSIIPVGQAVIGETGMKFYVDQVGKIFLVGLQLGAPLIVALVAANFSMGLIARTVPQLNVIMVGIPFTIGLGLAFMVIGFPFFIQALVVLNERMEKVVLNALRVLG